MNPAFMDGKSVAALLRSIADQVESGESLEGYIEYHVDFESPKEDRYGVVARYRIGNDMGQGGCMMIGEETTH